jgi:hypothetical protein
MHILEEIDYKLDPYEDRDKIIKQVMSGLIKREQAKKNLKDLLKLIWRIY